MAKKTNNDANEYFEKFNDFFEKDEEKSEINNYQEELDKFTEEEEKIDSDTALINMLSKKKNNEEENNDDSIVAFDDIVEPIGVEVEDVESSDNMGVEINMAKEQFNDLDIMEENDMEQKNSNKEYKISKDIIQMILLVISGFALVLSIWIMVKSFTPSQQYSKPILSYNVSNGIKAKIHLNQNNFYETEYLGMNELVPTPFIKYIEIDFSSMLQAQQKLNLNYTYKVTGEINAYYTGGSEEQKGVIWSKKYTFVNPVSKTVDASSNVKMAEKVRINYSTYNNLVNQYKLKASVPMDVYLTVNFTGNVNSDIENSNNNLKQNISTSVKIPLSVATVQLSTEDTTSGSKVLSDTKTIEASKNYVLLGFSIILFIASAATTVKLLINLKKMTENHSVLFKLNKILKDHDQVVVEVESVPKMKNATIIEIKQFKDMIDIQQELHIPILYYKSEVITENAFYIIHNNQIYKYVINSEMEQI